MTNIRLIAKDIDPTVVVSGERFSLNQATGRRTRAGGYVPAPFIADGKIVPSVGGGVSQFSTTLYNAAYFAGLRIETHRPHSFYIDRYPPGREATLNFADIDLAFTNDTAAPVLIRTATDATSVVVSHGRRVRSQTGLATVVWPEGHARAGSEGRGRRTVRSPGRCAKRTGPLRAPNGLSVIHPGHRVVLRLVLRVLLGGDVTGG